MGNILRRHGIVPAPKRRQTTTWKDFIAAHMAVLCGTDFFTVEVLTWHGVATYYVLFFIQLDTRRVTLAGLTMNPTKTWMEQIARNAMDPENGHLRHQRFILHDRDTKFCSSFRAILETEGVKCMALPPHSPNLNAFAECWVRSVKQECLRKLVLLGEGSLRRALSEYIAHYHEERNHQGKGNLLLFPSSETSLTKIRGVRRTDRLGGLLNYYSRAA